MLFIKLKWRAISYLRYVSRRCLIDTEAGEKDAAPFKADNYHEMPSFGTFIYLDLTNLCISNLLYCQFCFIHCHNISISITFLNHVDRIFPFWFAFDLLINRKIYLFRKCYDRKTSFVQNWRTLTINVKHKIILLGNETTTKTWQPFPSLFKI